MGYHSYDALIRLIYDYRLIQHGLNSESAAAADCLIIFGVTCRSLASNLRFKFQVSVPCSLPPSSMKILIEYNDICTTCSRDNS